MNTYWNDLILAILGSNMLLNLICFFLLLLSGDWSLKITFVPLLCDTCSIRRSCCTALPDSVTSKVLLSYFALCLLHMDTHARMCVNICVIEKILSVFLGIRQDSHFLTLCFITLWPSALLLSNIQCMFDNDSFMHLINMYWTHTLGQAPLGT